MKLLTALLLLLAPTTLLAFPAKWIKGSNGTIPEKAWRITNGKQQSEFYLCRAKYKASEQPGKIKAGYKGCRISYEGQELSITQYEVLTSTLTTEPLPGSWVHGRDGWVPEHAWRIGYATSGRPFYLCLADYKGLQPGKIRMGIGGCDIAVQGREISQRQYWVLNRS